MALERRQFSDTRLHHPVDHRHLKNPYAHTLEVSQRPDFRILTSLIWLRTKDVDHDWVGKVFNIAHLTHYHNDITTCECRPDLGLLRLHRDRLASAAEALGWRHIQALERTDFGVQILHASIMVHLRSLPEIGEGVEEKRKLRILISKRGIINVDSSIMSISSTENAQPRPFMPTTLDLDTIDDSVCRVFVDSRPTHAGFFTTHKTSYRIHYEAARTRAGITKASPMDSEVLLYNDEGETTETSCCTVYFNRSNRWITPAAICGSNQGVTRRLALDAGLCKQGIVELADLEEGEMIWLSNAARGFFLGQICLSRDTSPLSKA